MRLLSLHPLTRQYSAFSLFSRETTTGTGRTPDARRPVAVRVTCTRTWTSSLTMLWPRRLLWASGDSAF